VQDRVVELARHRERPPAAPAASIAAIVAAAARGARTVIVACARRGRSARRRAVVAPSALSVRSMRRQRPALPSPGALRAASSARVLRPRANCAGVAIASTSVQSTARCPRTASRQLVQKMSARSWRTLRLSGDPRQAHPWPGSTPSRLHLRQQRPTTSDSVDQARSRPQGERELVAPAGAGTVHTPPGERMPECADVSSMPLRVSLVNLQKFTFHAWLETPSMKMFAPEQKTRSLRS
jgi:hypothetical protein